MKQLSFFSDVFSVTVHDSTYGYTKYVTLRFGTLAMCYFGVADASKVKFYQNEVTKIAEQLNCGGNIYTKIETLERLAKSAGTHLTAYDWILVDASNYNKGKTK